MERSAKANFVPAQTLHCDSRPDVRLCPICLSTWDFWKFLPILVSSEFDSFLQSAQGPTPTQPGYRMKGAQCQKIFSTAHLSTFCYILINSHLPSLPIWSVTPRCVIQRGLLYFENISMKIINYLQNHFSLLFRRVSFMKSKYDNKSCDTVALIKQQHHDETPTVGNSQPLVSCTVSCTVVQT